MCTTGTYTYVHRCASCPTYSGREFIYSLDGVHVGSFVIQKLHFEFIIYDFQLASVTPALS